MRRYRIENTSEKDESVVIDGDSFHHIVDVCRQNKGSRFEVLTPSGWALFVEIEQVHKKSAIAKVLEKRQIPALKTPWIHLAMSMPKIATFESVLEKAVELGVYQIHPFFSDYSFVKSQKNILENKISRFEKIIQSATQQTGRGDWMTLAPAGHLSEILQSFQKQTNTSGIFAYEGAGELSLKSALQEAQKTFSSPAKLENLWIFVGSEGGFSTQEVEIFKKVNLFPVSLGQQVLRVETACVTLLSIIKYELDLF
jgi:16S rRNA (uracil1498-N3)-methyltransferase